MYRHRSAGAAGGQCRRLTRAPIPKNANDLEPTGPGRVGGGLGAEWPLSLRTAAGACRHNPLGTAVVPGWQPVYSTSVMTRDPHHGRVGRAGAWRSPFL